MTLTSDTVSCQFNVSIYVFLNTPHIPQLSI